MGLPINKLSLNPGMSQTVHFLQSTENEINPALHVKYNASGGGGLSFNPFPLSPSHCGSLYLGLFCVPGSLNLQSPFLGQTAGC